MALSALGARKVSVGTEWRHLVKWLAEARYAPWNNSSFRFDQLLEEDDLTPTTIEEWRLLCMQEWVRDKMAAQGII